MRFGELFEFYYERHAKVRLKCPENVFYWGKSHLARWKDLELSAITPHAVQLWVDELGASSTTSANRAVNQLGAILNWGAKRGYYTGPNPCSQVERFSEKSRERFLMPEEMDRFRAALDRQPDVVRDLFWMFLLTGARRANVLSMRWDELDFRLGVWRIPPDKFKNGDSHLVPLTAPALAILERRRQKVKSAWVFPGKKLGTHLKEPKRAWAKVLASAGVSDLRIHDLRRTVGSYMAIQGVSQYVIGKTLGHKDQRSTAVYARLNLDPVRKALDDLQSFYI